MLDTTIAEWSLHHHSGWTRRLAAVAALAAIAVVFSAHSNIGATVSQFEQSVEFLTSSGESLQSALAAPTSESTEGGMTTIDNPVRHDLERVSLALRAVDGTTIVGTVLDTVTFIVLPLLMMVVGAHAATLDIRSGMRKVRATRAPMTTLVLARAVTVGLHSSLVVVTVAAVSLLANVMWGVVLEDPTAGSPVDFVASDVAPVAPIVTKMAFSVAVGALFGLVGLAVGEMTRSTSWPLVIAAAALFLLPFVSAWDPRNLVAVASTAVFDFWGQFTLRPPISVRMPAAVVGLVVYGSTALVGAVAVARHRSRLAA